MTSLYSNQVRQFLHSRPWPKGLIWEVAEFDDQLKFRLFRDNINALDSDAKLLLAKLLNESLSKISADGIPIFTWVVKGDGKSDSS